jgi:cytochrome c oxidase subunit 2
MLIVTNTCVKNMLLKTYSVLATIFFGLYAPAMMAGESKLNMPKGVTEISRETYNLHMIIFWICVVIGVIVYGFLIYTMIRYRSTRSLNPASFSHNTTVEVIWTAIPFLILVGMAYPSTKVLTKVYDTTESTIDILITGYQWRWQYTYLTPEGPEVSYFSNLSTPNDQIQNQEKKEANYLLEVDEPLVIPANTKVRFLLTSADVIHSWWVPEFAVKKDAIPGFINEAWVIAEEPGIYRGQCTELCGRLHGFMPVVVNVVEHDEFSAWLAAKQSAAAGVADAASKTFSMSQLMAEGETVYNTYCMACHQQNGQGLLPAFPALAGSVIATGPIEDHVDIVLHGKAGTAMAAFGSQLNAVEIAAVVTYERNAWGNNMGDMVQPTDVAALQVE